MSKVYFTSDWHLNDPRIGTGGQPNLFYRPFSSIEDQNLAMLDGLFKSSFSDGDTLYHLGDVVYSALEPFNTDIYLSKLKELYPNSKFNLIIGNYDEKQLGFLQLYFNIIGENCHIEINGRKYFLNHYPSKCIQKDGDDNIFNITGHIHGLWKVQKNMVNVGVDAWHFKPVSEDEIDFVRNACEKYYDNNVFPY